MFMFLSLGLGRSRADMQRRMEKKKSRLERRDKQRRMGHRYGVVIPIVTFFYGYSSFAASHFLSPLAVVIASRIWGGWPFSPDKYGCSLADLSIEYHTKIPRAEER